MGCLLLSGAELALRNQLLAIQKCISLGQKIALPRIQLADLTQNQFSEINIGRIQTNRPPLTTLRLEYDGRHHYESRTKDGYTIDDIVTQIITVLDSNSIVIKEQRHPQYVNLKSSNDRADGYGNLVRDVAAFNVSSRNPTTELYSVIPQGDVRKPI
jgi:hypothetical protein